MKYQKGAKMRYFIPVLERLYAKWQVEDHNRYRYKVVQGFLEIYVWRREIISGLEMVGKPLIRVLERYWLITSGWPRKPFRSDRLCGAWCRSII